MVCGAAATNVSKRQESRMTMMKLFFAFGSGWGAMAPAGRATGLTGALGGAAGFFLKRSNKPM